MGEEMSGSVQFVKGVGPKRAKLLKKLNIETILDLLYYFPRDYRDRRKIKKIKHARPGGEVTVEGEVIRIREEKSPRGTPILKVTFSDETGALNGVWFNQSFLKQQFNKGDKFSLSGEIEKKNLFQYNKKEIYNPVYEKNRPSSPRLHTGRVVPVYPLTEGLTQKRMRYIIYNGLQDYADHLEEFIPDFIRGKFNFIGLVDSLRSIHFPGGKEDYIRARRRLVFEELFLLQLLVLIRKKGFVDEKGISHHKDGDILSKFFSSLPFEFTDAQKSVWEEIKYDMEKDVPMQRLLQGDVGSGKTVVAASALIKCMDGGYQGVFMAPTEILAGQHYLRLKELLSPLGFEIMLLTGSHTASEQRELKERISTGEGDLIIGTHALFQEDVAYHQVGLVVIDEQHRFGVEQRYRLKEKAGNPDLLVMTATPIPRSLALTFYGDLDLSIIDEMPPGRSPVITTWRKQNARSRIYQFVREKIREGRQAYVVCPLIEPSEELDALAAEEVYEQLKNDMLTGCRTGLLHGQQPAEKKEETMEKFRQGKLDVLISTTVIEVGVDVPNASVMVIENAERFGLAQLHQLRGRVGRGEYQSYCILVARPTTEKARKRLEVITGSGDGFEISEEDLKIRGPGEFFGTKQHGIPDLKIASIIRDRDTVVTARREAEKVLNKTGWRHKYPALVERLEELKIKH
ncbi:MAG: ATP-dependent DNA helicase RecG [Halanaerobiaceae bacterium]